MSFFFGAKGKIRLPFSRPKNLSSFEVCVSSTEIFGSGHVQDGCIQGSRIPGSVNSALGCPKSKFFSRGSRASRSTFEVLIVPHHLQECFNVIVDNCYVEIATPIAGRLQPFVVNGLSKVARGHFS
jgi:hypothetical protein